MPNSDYENIKELFQKYIAIKDDKVKELLIEDYKKNMPHASELIDTLKKAFDGLKKNEGNQKLFVEKVFGNELNEGLINNLLSQDANKTVAMDTINQQTFSIVSFYNFKKDVNTETCATTEEKITMNDGSQLYKSKIDENDTRFYNYIVEKCLSDNVEDLMLFLSHDGNFIASTNAFPQVSNSTLVKEESLCDTKEIQYFIDRIIGENDNKIYLRRILIDLITNQNYRVLSNGVGIINSDSSQNDYYVLDGVTLKKEMVIKSLLLNYFEDIKDITNIIMDNYNIIINMIDSLIKSNEYNSDYLYRLKENITKVKEEALVINRLNTIDSGQEDKKETRENINLAFENKIITLKRNLLKSNEKVLKKAGYVSIFTIVSGIVIFGILIAYLMLK